MNCAFRAIVRGRVQGVFFRRHTNLKAKELGLGGWVRNLPDGNVEVWAEGGKERLDKLADWLNRGPPSAIVDRVELSWHEPAGHSSFETRF